MSRSRRRSSPPSALVALALAAAIAMAIIACPGVSAASGAPAGVSAASGAPAGAPGAAPTSTVSTIDQLLAGLTDPDATVRQTAADRLVKIGAPARPHVLRASRAGDPEQRAQAAQVLMRLPWWSPDDPPEVRATLERYGQIKDRMRGQVLRRLSTLGAVPALLRLLNEDPSDSIRWGVVVLLWSPRSAQDQRLMREFQPGEDEHPAALMLAGRAWAERDRDKALDYFRRAVEADAVRPTADGGLLALAVEQLLAADITAGRFDAAAELLRRQVPRHLQGGSTGARRAARRLLADLGMTDGAPGGDRGMLDLGLTHRPTSSLAALLALHEYFGPLRGYEWDLHAWTAPPDVDAQRPFAPLDPDGAVPRPIRPAAPTVIASAGRLLGRLGAAPALPLGLTRQVDVEDRFDAAAFFTRIGLRDAAEVELRDILDQSESTPHVQANALFLLSRLTAAREDDTATADLLERALALKDKHNMEWASGQEQDVRADLLFRRARAAHAAGDKPAADKHAAELAALAPSNTDAAINIVNWLKETSRTGAARLLFERIYRDGADRVQAMPDEPGAKNDLAWLCARTGERLEDAVKLATEAVEADPDNAAFLDTLAEAHFRAGNRAEAIKLETRAIELRPGDPFMQKQLERFKSSP